MRLTNHNQPIWLLHTLSIGLWVTQRLNLDVLGLGDLAGGAVTDENWLTTPFDDDLQRAQLASTRPNVSR